MRLGSRMRPHVPSLLLLILAAGGSVGSAIPEGSKASHYVKVDVKGGAIDAKGNQALTVSLDISPKIYLYANVVAHDLANLRLKIDVLQEDKLLEADFKYPSGTVKGPEDLRYETYQGKVVIKGTVRRGKLPIVVRVHMLGNLLVSV